MTKKYFKYYVCGEHMLRALTKEIAETKFKKLGEDPTNMKSFLDYKKAARLTESLERRIVYGKHS